MFLLRYRRRHRYGDPAPLPPPLVPPGCEDDAPDPDEAIGSLAYYFEELRAEPDETSAIDSVNFVNLGGPEAEPEWSCDHRFSASLSAKSKPR